MLIDLNPEDPRPVYRQIADEVQRSIAIGMLKPEDPLPATRKIAVELKVNPNTVQHAYATLEREGLVYVKRGLGTFVAARPKDWGPRNRNNTTVARQIAERRLREGFRHGLLASDLIAALREIAPGPKPE